MREHLPDVEAWAYGSRVNGRGHKGSDLDLVLRGPGLREIPLDQLVDFKDTVRESNIPFLVEARDWARLPERFQREIEGGYLVVVEGARSDSCREWYEGTYGSVRADRVERPLRTLCAHANGIQTGPFGSQLHKKDYVLIGTPIVTVEHLGDNRLVHKNLPRVSDADRERLSKYRLQAGDIVFSRVGSVDRRALVRQEEEGWLFSGRCLRVRSAPDQIDPIFLSYFFGWSAFREHIKSIAVGATMPSLNTKLLSDIIVSCPSLPEQRAIAHILSTLDDKIELNRRMNETLEAMARALFKSWFVDFDPVRAKMEGRDTGLPKRIADLFPDGLVDSKFGKIPKAHGHYKEWEVFTLNDLVDRRSKTIAPSTLPKTKFEHFSIPAYDANLVPNIDLGCDIKSRKTIIPPDAVLLSKLNPRIPRVWFPSEVTGRLQVCSTEFLVFTAKKPANRMLLYSLFTSPPFQTMLQSMVTGTSGSHQRVSADALLSCKVMKGTPELFDAFFELVAPLQIRMLNCIEESQILLALSNELLPRLVSGRLQVKDAEQGAKEVT